jgi:hypothetical protein
MDSHHISPSNTPASRPPGTAGSAAAAATVQNTGPATACFPAGDAAASASSAGPSPAAPAGGATAARPASHFRHKAIAGLLAAVLGCTGAQLWYLGLPRAWLVLAFSLLTVGTALRAEFWYFSPAFFLFLIPVVGGFIHALVLCLTPDEKFDARYNAGQTRRSHTGWLPVLVAIFTLAVGSSILVTGLALFFQAMFEGRFF